MRILCAAWQCVVGRRCEPERAAEREERAPEPAAEKGGEADADNLRAIKGIGIVTENRLMAAGITTFEQLARAKPEDIRKALVGDGRGARFEEWIKQARELARETRPVAGRA